MTIFSRYLLIFFAMTTLFGCETLPEKSAAQVQWQQHQKQLMALSHYQVRGKLAYLSPEQRISLSFNLLHENDISELKLLNVFGSTVLTLTVTPLMTEVITDKGETYQGEEANRLFRQLTGITLPVTQFLDWVKGLPTQADSYQLNELHTLSSLQKAQWQVAYTRYRDTALGNTTPTPETLPMPYKITLNDQEVTIKIQVAKWELTS